MQRLLDAEDAGAKRAHYPAHGADVGASFSAFRKLAAGDAAEGSNGKKDRVAVEAPADCESGRFQQTDDFGEAIAAVGPNGGVVLAAESVESRNLQDQHSAGREDPERFQKSPRLVDVAMAEDVDGGDQVERLIRER